MGRETSQGSKTIVTISMICWAFIISYFPVIVNAVMKQFKVNPGDWYYTLQIFSAGINVVINPIIYCVQNKRFREYLKGIIGMENNTESSGDTPSTSKYVKAIGIGHQRETLHSLAPSEIKVTGTVV